MKMNTFFKLLLLTFFSFVISINPIISQENIDKCKVLDKNINEYYEGECKKGLAHGKGIAKGIDTYNGKLKKGLPHGYGKYVWKNGSYYEGKWRKGKRNGKGKMYNSLTKKETKGIWKKDVFIKEITERPYEIVRQRGIT
ncbi:MAG: hypothetical protein PF487_02600, partial [Bacteroidales bacterium]|nr:hypothetical protein [Bacteroidales bacterium]